MSYKVLIVEDDPMVAMINEQYVCRNSDFTVAASFRDGQKALDYLENNSVDLIVLDVFMPYLDGIETLKRIRKMKVSAEVIMVTAANDAATLEETMHLGVIDYLIKPFAYERFQVALEKFAAQKAALKGASVLNQSVIDNIIKNAPSVPEKPAAEKSFPKGIQEKTLNLILAYLKENSGWQSGDMISEKLGLSSVTVRHYMTYLVKTSSAVQDVNYGTGGRPSMLYKAK